MLDMNCRTSSTPPSPRWRRRARVDAGEALRPADRRGQQGRQRLPCRRSTRWSTRPSIERVVSALKLDTIAFEGFRMPRRAGQGLPGGAGRLRPCNTSARRRAMARCQPETKKCWFATANIITESDRNRRSSACFRAGSSGSSSCLLGSSCHACAVAVAAASKCGSKRSFG